MTQRYVKLPNNEVVPVDDDDFILVKVEVDLSEFIDNDLEGILDVLSEQATGTEVLSDISYSVTGHHGNTLEIDVTGKVDLIEVEEVNIDTLPMIEFEVQVTRIGYGSRTTRLSARTIAEAVEIADDDAGNHLYSEDNSDYVIQAYPV